MVREFSPENKPLQEGNGIEDAKRILSISFPEQSSENLDNILSNLKDGALEAIKDVRTSTNPVQRRRYMNAFIKEWKNEKTEE